ncbi:AAEL012375-PA, partial [Aedes aegypti]
IMRLDELVAWYQKKIGTYDKQQWEKTIEQKILAGINHLPLKNTKLKTELIDVDLVRGSTFPKAKSKLSILTVIYLAALRLLLLPIYAKWWVQQTSPRVFVLLLALYMLQMINLGIYSYNEEHIVSMSEFLIPIALSLLLSVIHSQIVATGSHNNSLCMKMKKCQSHSTLKKRERIRRKRRARTTQPGSGESTTTTTNTSRPSAENPEKVKIKGLNGGAPVANLNVNQPEATVDDDGFESLNGKSSGGEDSSNAGGSSEIYYNKKLPYTNTWINGVDKDTRSDSDTDTLRNTPTTSHDQFGPSLTQGNSHPPGKPRRHLSSESGIEVQRHDRSKSPLLLLDDDTTHRGSAEADVESKGSGFDENLESSGDTDEENDFDLQQTESSEECSYSSDLNHTDGQNEHSDDDYDLEDAPTIILNPPCGATDRVSCTIWDAREAKKAEMSVLDISSAIIERVEAMPETCDYVYIGVVLSIILSLIPAFCRLCDATVDSSKKASFSCIAILRFAFGESTWEKTVLVLGFVLRLCLTYLVFFLLAVAERTFKQRFLYAKLFSHLTSSRRAQKSGIPHFRLNKVRNIKTWLCVRSYLKRRGPQNSVDVIVSAAFIITLLLLAFLSVEWLKDSVHLHSQFNLEALVWSCAFGTFLLRFMTLGTKINKKYKSVSVLITEQINLYVQIEQKPNKKEELMISNNVLKLAADLLKELESPFKISGLSANPYLYTTVKVVILSALSGVLSEMLGFKLKLHKIKIK